MRRQSPEDSNNIMSNWLTRRVSLSFHQFQSERKNNVHRQRQQSLIFRIRYGLMGTNGRVCLSTSTAVEWAGEIRSAHDSSSFNCCWLCRVSNLKQYNHGGAFSTTTAPVDRSPGQQDRFGWGFYIFGAITNWIHTFGLWALCLGRRDLCKTMKIHRMACETESSSFINLQYTGNTITEKKDRMRWTEDVLGWDLLKRYDSLPAKPSKYYHHYPAGAVVSCCGLTSALRTIEVAGWLGKYKGTRRSGLGPKEFNNEHEQFIVWHFSQRLVKEHKQGLNVVHSGWQAIL